MRRLGSPRRIALALFICLSLFVPLPLYHARQAGAATTIGRTPASIGTPPIAYADAVTPTATMSATVTPTASLLATVTPTATVSGTVAPAAPPSTTVAPTAAVSMPLLGAAFAATDATATPSTSSSSTSCPFAFASPSIAVAEGGLLDDSSFVRDVSIPDCTYIPPGTSFTKTWEIRNTGTTTWDSRYHWHFEAGAALGSTSGIAVPSTIPPGGTVRFSVRMTAPTRPRGYIGYWQMTNPSGAVFGQQAWVAIVSGTPPPASPTPLPGTPSPTPTATPSPSATPPVGGGGARPPTAVGTPRPTPVPWFGPAVGRSFLAEGYTGPGYQEYLSLLNPRTKPVRVQITIYRSDGATRIVNLRLGRLAHQSLDVNLLAPRASTALKIEADATIVAERALYSGKNGSIVAGTPLPRRTWYISESYVGPNFSDGLRIFNPYDTATSVTITSYRSDGKARVSHRVVRGDTRLNVGLDDIAPVGGSALRVDSALPVVVESVVQAAGTSGPTAAMALTTPSRRWYFPDGGTKNGDKEYITIFNPAAKGTAAVTLRFVTASGYKAPLTIHARPHSRAVFIIQGLIHQNGVAADVESDRPVIAQQIRYMRRGDVALTDGAARTSRLWALADGYAGHGFKEWIIVLNPNRRPVTTKIRLIGRHGLLRTVTVHERPGSRDFVYLPSLIRNGSVAALVDANGPIVAGRTLLFNSDKGLSTSVGVALASR